MLEIERKRRGKYVSIVFQATVRLVVQRGLGPLDGEHPAAVNRLLPHGISIP